MFSIPYIQSRLLQALAGYANGSRELYLEAEISRGLLVTAARRLHLLRQTQGRPIRFNAPEASTAPSRADMTAGEQVSRSSVLASNNEALTESLRRDQEKQWKRWLEEEERCRLGWGIYVSSIQSGQRISSVILNITFIALRRSAGLPARYTLPDSDVGNRQKASERRRDMGSHHCVELGNAQYCSNKVTDVSDHVSGERLFRHTRNSLEIERSSKPSV
jgi:hypothetical protein